MARLFNRTWMTVSGTPGTGTITLGAAFSSAYLTFAEAGVANGDTVSYVIEEGTDFEIGVGTYTTAGTALSRDAVTVSKISGVAGTTKLTLTSAATVFINARREDFLDIRNIGGLTPHRALICKQVSVTTVDVDAVAVTLFNVTGDPRRFESLNESPAITASGANGLDTGAEAASTWYYLFAIGKPDGTLDSLISLNPSAPNMPAGYTYWGLIGAFYNNASSNILSFNQSGGLASSVTPITVLSNGTATTYTAVSLAAAIPPNAIAVFGQLAAGVSSGTANPFIGLAPAGSGTTPTYGEIFVQQSVLSTGTSKLYLPFESPITTPQEVLYYVGGANAQGVIVVSGWRY